MQIFIKVPFANAGDKAVVPEPVQAGGEVSMTDGFPVKYSQDPNTTGLRIEREDFNWLLYMLTLNVRKLQTEAFPDFITTADNGGVPFPYGVGAVVYYGGLLYQSKVAANVDLPTVTASWVALDPYNRAIERTSPAFTGTPTAPTPLAGDNTTKLATTAFVAAAFASGIKSVQTASQVWNSTTTFWTFSHTLGKLPATYQLVFTCLTADHGFVPGNVVYIAPSAAQSTSSTAEGYVSRITTTTIELSIDTNTQGLLLHEWNGGNNFVPTTGRWDIRFNLLG